MPELPEVETVRRGLEPALSGARLARVRANRPDLRFHQLILLSGADYPNRSERFDVVYHLLSLTKNHRIRVSVRTDEDTPVPSICAVYPVADWYEFLQPMPKPLYHELFPASFRKGFELKGDEDYVWAYYAALRRVGEILRHIATIEEA